MKLFGKGCVVLILLIFQISSLHSHDSQNDLEYQQKDRAMALHSQPPSVVVQVAQPSVAQKENTFSMSKVKDVCCGIVCSIICCPCILLWGCISKCADDCDDRKF